MSNKFKLIAALLFLVVFACKKEEEPIDLEEDPPVPPVDYTISGTTWTSILPSFFADERVLAMATLGNKMVVTYLDINSISGTYNGSTFTEHNQVLGSGTGLEKIEIVDGVLYGLGLFGAAGGFVYDTTDIYDPWNGALYIGTNAMAIQKFNGNTFVGCGISPYVRYDQSGFVQVGDGLNGTVYELINFNGKLIAGGSFSSSGATAVENVAQWDGTSWTALDQGLDGTVKDLVVFDGKLIAIGAFDQSGAGNTACRFVSVWNGTTWEALGGGLVGGDLTGALVATVYHDQLIIGGKFDGGGSVSSSNIIKWDGSQWISLAGGTSDKIEEMCIYNNKLYIANGMNMSDSYFLLRLD